MANHPKDISLSQHLETAQPDVTLIAAIDNVKLEAHQKILSAVSYYFHAMFHTEMKEARTSEIRLDHVDGPTLKLLIDYIYTDEIKLNSENVESLLRAAHYFQINKLLDECWDFMEQQLDSSNCLGIAFIAEQYGNIEILEKCAGLICCHIEELITGQEFLELDEDQLDMLFTTIGGRYGLQEKFVHTLVAWCLYDEKNRQNSLSNLLSKHIHCRWLEPEFIAENGPKISKILESSELIDSWLKWQPSPKSGEEQKEKLLLMYVPPNQDHFAVKLYNEESKSWSHEEWPKPLERTKFGMVVFNNQLIIAGGCYRGGRTNKVEYLNLETMKWNSLYPMSTRLLWPELAEIDGVLYILDRYTGFFVKYDFSTQECQNLYDRSEGFNMNDTSTSAVLDGKLFVSNGGESYLDYYNPVKNRWWRTYSSTVQKTTTRCVISGMAYFANCMLKIDKFSMTGLNGKMYTFDGSPSTVDVGKYCQRSTRRYLQYYDISKREWTVMKSLRKNFKCCTYKGRIYACCELKSNDKGDFVCFVEEYKPESDEWKSLPSAFFKDSSAISIEDNYILTV